jgi:hypothetical protein
VRDALAGGEFDDDNLARLLAETRWRSGSDINFFLDLKKVLFISASSAY